VTPGAALEQQLAFALELRDELTRIADIVHELRSVRDQARAGAERLRGAAEVDLFVKKAGDLALRCDALEDKLHNPKAKIGYDILAQPGGTRLYSRLATLYDWADAGDGAPTQGMREVHARHARELQELAGEWSAILETDVAALNRQAKERGIDVVVVKPKAP